MSSQIASNKQLSYKEALAADEILFYFVENLADVNYVNLSQIPVYIIRIKTTICQQKNKQKLQTF
jgi:hypothetical protein